MKSSFKSRLARLTSQLAVPARRVVFITGTAGEVARKQAALIAGGDLLPDDVLFRTIYEERLDEQSA